MPNPGSTTHQEAARAEPGAPEGSTGAPSNSTGRSDSAAAAAVERRALVANAARSPMLPAMAASAGAAADQTASAASRQPAAPLSSHDPRLLSRLPSWPPNPAPSSGGPVHGRPTLTLGELAWNMQRHVCNGRLAKQGTGALVTRAPVPSCRPPLQAAPPPGLQQPCARGPGPPGVA